MPSSVGKPLTRGPVTLSHHGVLRYKAGVPRVLFIENHDSFSWNVIDALPFSRNEIRVVTAPEAVAASPPLDSIHSTGRPLNSPGMGLHYLMNAAIDLYGGTVSFRTKNYFLNIKKAKKQSAATYGAKIIRYSTSQSIPGNMITVRLPLAPLI